MKLEDDWYPGSVPHNIEVDATACLGSSYSFTRFRSTAHPGLVMRRGSSLYGTILDVGERGRVVLDEFAMVTSAYLCCDSEIYVGPYVMVAWGAVLLGSYRASSATRDGGKRIRESDEARPIRLEPNSWVGFEACVLPGVTIGEGAIVGARAVVSSDVPPFTVAVGNPARIVRQLR